jgi:hypothetical protein
MIDGRNSVTSLLASNLYYKCVSLVEFDSLCLSQFVVFLFVLGLCFFIVFFVFFLYLFEDFIIACHVASGQCLYLLDLIIFDHLACPPLLSPHLCRPPLMQVGRGSVTQPNA